MAVEFRKASISGERYLRPSGSSATLQSSNLVSPKTNGCPTEQAHITVGSANDMILSFVSFDDSVSSKVWYCTGCDGKSSIISNILSNVAVGSRISYSQLLSVNKQLLTPSMGKPEGNVTDILYRQNTSRWAYDSVTKEQYANYRVVNTVQYGDGLYSDPYMTYDSPYIHTVTLSNLIPGNTYYYQPDGSCTIYHFKVPRQASGGLISFTLSDMHDRHGLRPQELNTPSIYPYTIGVSCDLGQTAVSNASISALLALQPEFVLIGGDLSYADGWTPLWDSFGRLIERLGAYVPILTTGGNHEFVTETWQSYMYRWPTPYQESGSTHFCYWGKEMGVTHIISLCSYAGSNADTNQYRWLTKYLSNKIDRVKTPWVIVMLHSPLYNTNVGHWKEAELFRVNIEPLLYQYGVDIVIAGHVHAYERTHPVYNNQLDSCGMTHLNLGDGGNREGAYIPWRQPAEVWSAFREASFGVGDLKIISPTEIQFSWHRHACDSDSTINYHIDFSDTCVTFGDNSIQSMLTSDIFTIIKPDRSQCPNKWKSSPNLQNKGLIQINTHMKHEVPIFKSDVRMTQSISRGVTLFNIIPFFMTKYMDIDLIYVYTVVLICVLIIALITLTFMYLQLRSKYMHVKMNTLINKNEQSI